MKTMQTAVIALMEATARKCGVGVGYPRGSSTYTGHIVFWASHVTQGDARDLLRCLGALGVSRGSWQHVETNMGVMRRAALSDLDGEVRGHVLVLDDGSGSASLDYALSRPLQCFEIVLDEAA